MKVIKTDNLKKARTSAKSLKENKRYKDAPRFRVIYGYEDNFRLSFQEEMVLMQKDLLKTMHKMGPKKNKIKR